MSRIRTIDVSVITSSLHSNVTPINNTPIDLYSTSISFQNLVSPPSRNNQPRTGWWATTIPGRRRLHRLLGCKRSLRVGDVPSPSWGTSTGSMMRSASASTGNNYGRTMLTGPSSIVICSTRLNSMKDTMTIAWHRNVCASKWRCDRMPRSSFPVNTLAPEQPTTSNSSQIS